MNRESLEKLRFDRRLIRRRGWMSGSELERRIEELPDSATKATTLGAVADERGGAEPSSRDAAPNA